MEAQLQRATSTVTDQDQLQKELTQEKAKQLQLEEKLKASADEHNRLLADLNLQIATLQQEVIHLFG